MSVMLCTGAAFVKKNSCLVARIALFDTAGLHSRNHNGSVWTYFQAWWKTIKTNHMMHLYPIDS